MRIAICIILMFAASVFASEDNVALPNRPQVRDRISFNADWKFFRCGKMPDQTEQAEPADLEQPNADDTQWNDLDLPHDWAVQGPFHRGESRWGNLPYEGIGWYRKHFNVSKADKGKRIFID
ncbi:MAG: beta-galactosidase, partial [Planctomycetes bacterium]|nr:beta-galactosidase [Planctomycetota bacterium]